MAGAKEFPLSLIVRAVDKATGPLRQIDKSVQGITKTANKVAGALSLSVTGPLAVFGGVSVAAFGKFQEGMSNVATLIDTNIENIEEMSKTVLAMSRRLPVPLDQLTAGLTEARSAGVSASDQFAVLEGSTKLAVVGMGQVSEAVDIVTSAMNAFNLKGADAANIYNTIFQATNVGKASISDLARGFGSVAGTVANAGIRLEEYMASVAALTTTGLPAAEAHTQLRAVIAGLTRQGKLTSAVFKRLGVKDMKELIRQSGGLVPALNRVKSVLRGNDTLMLKLLGSTEALNAVLGLTGNQAESFRDALELMEGGGNGLEEAFGKKLGTHQAVMQRFKNNLEAISVSIGRILVPMIERLVPLLDRLADGWEGLDASTQQAVVGLGAAAAAIGPVIYGVGALAKVFGVANTAVMWAAGWGKYLWMMRASIMAGLVPSLSAAAASVWAFTAALLANPITGVVAAIAGAAYLIYKNWDAIALFFKFLWEDVKEIFVAYFAWVGKHLSWTPLGMLVNNWEPIVEFFRELWTDITGFFQSAWEKISPIVDELLAVGKFTPIGQAISAISDVASTGKIGAATLWDVTPPTLGAERAAPNASAMSTEARVVVDMSNVPAGTRVTTDPTSTASLDLSVGYSMVTP